jgi:signal transduction histidine kinase
MAGYTFSSDEPTIVEDLNTETRFRGSPLLVEHGAVSGLSVVIRGRRRPWGALGAHTRERRRFSGDDIFFLQSVSNILGQAIELRRSEAERTELLEREREAREESERRREALERVTESRARLMRGFSHDVKNPLGAADGFLQLLQDGLMGPLDERQLGGVERARRGIESALKLIDDLLSFARAQAGEMEVALAPTDMLALVRGVAEGYQAQAVARGLAFSIELPASLPTIESDADRVRQVLGNLLSNAVKYTEQGGITVSAREREGEGAPGPGRWIAISVADTGPGIPNEKQPLLFEEFERIEPKSGARGTGIGLFIGQQIARALGGVITVESEVGQGSTFTLWLPLRAAPA